MKAMTHIVRPGFFVSSEYKAFAENLNSSGNFSNHDCKAISNLRAFETYPCTLAVFEEVNTRVRNGELRSSHLPAIRQRRENDINPVSGESLPSGMLSASDGCSWEVKDLKSPSSCWFSGRAQRQSSSRAVMGRPRQIDITLAIIRSMQKLLMITSVPIKCVYTPPDTAVDLSL